MSRSFDWRSSRSENITYLPIHCNSQIAGVPNLNRSHSCEGSLVHRNPCPFVFSQVRISQLQRSLRSSFNWIAGFSSTRRTCHVQNANAIYSNSERIFTENALQSPDSSQKISPFTDSPWALLLLHHEEPFVFHGSCSWATGRHPAIQSWCVRSTELDTS